MTYAPTPPPAPKKSRAGLIIGISIAAMVLLCAGCVAAYSGLGSLSRNIADQTAGREPGPKRESGGSHLVRYEIDGTGEAVVNWARGTGDQDFASANLPWSKEITVDDESFGLIVWAYPGDKAGSVTGCRILVDGQERAKAKADRNMAKCTFTFVGKP